MPKWETELYFIYNIRRYYKDKDKEIKTDISLKLLIDDEYLTDN